MKWLRGSSAAQRVPPPVQRGAMVEPWKALRSTLRPRIDAMGNPVLATSSALVAPICHRHHIRRLALFGSQLKGTARPDSDIDLLVEFDPAARPTLLDMAQIESELSEAFQGRKVDLRTAQDLSPYFRDEVLRTAQVCHDAG